MALEEWSTFVVLWHRVDSREESWRVYSTKLSKLRTCVNRVLPFGLKTLTQKAWQSFYYGKEGRLVRTPLRRPLLFKVLRRSTLLKKLRSLRSSGATEDTDNFYNTQKYTRQCVVKGLIFLTYHLLSWTNTKLENTVCQVSKNLNLVLYNFYVVLKSSAISDKNKVMKFR